MNQSNWIKSLTASVVIIAATGTAYAVPTIDGNASVADGYTSLSIQNTDTQFGNVINADPIRGFGSEIDQVFGKVEGGRLYIVVAGNLEPNFNKLDVYIDSVAGGSNVINGANLPLDVDGFCCGGTGSTNGALQNSNGLKFDAGFEADYFMTFTHGFEKLRPNLPEELEFWAASAHYADLTMGTSGAVVSAGMQLAQRGLPQVLRGSTADFNQDGRVDGGDFLIWQRNVGATNVNRTMGDATGDGNVDGNDLTTWQAAYGFDVVTSPIDANYFAPLNDIDKSDILLGPALQGLNQGDLIDKNYALGANGGCNADNSGAGCAVRELEFALPVDVLNDPSNNWSHRNMENTIGLQMAFDNSNTAGVGGGPDYFTPTTGDPANVTTGVEFSIPLSQIGNPGSLSDIRLTIFVNGGDHNYLSNQISGTGFLLGNLGGDGSGAFTGSLAGIDLSLISGSQFVTLTVPPLSAAAAAVPEPTSLALLTLAVTALVGCRRR